MQLPLPPQLEALRRRTFIAVAAGAGLAAPAVLRGASAQGRPPAKIRITRQPSIIYMPTFLIEARQLIQKQAAVLGVPGLEVEWITFGGGGNATDALLSGNVEFVNTGPGNMLLLWDRTRGGVKGVVGTSALPLVLVTRNPAVKTIRDFTEKDRIAVPTVRISTQAVVLQIACAKEFGEGQWNRLDANTVQLSHPDAFAALMNPGHEVNSHFSAPPFIGQELDRVPGCRAILNSNDVMGGKLSVAMIFTTTRFADANPKVVEAVKRAAQEAVKSIREDTRAAVETYREASGDRMPADEIMRVLRQPGMMEFDPRPDGVMRFAEHLHRTGTLKTMPKAWTDAFLPAAHDLGGS